MRNVFRCCQFNKRGDGDRKNQGSKGEVMGDKTKIGWAGALLEGKEHKEILE